MNQIGGAGGSGGKKEKVTQAQISAQRDWEREQKQKEGEQRRLEARKITVPEQNVEENLNRLDIEGEHARTVDEAIRVLRYCKGL